MLIQAAPSQRLTSSGRLVPMCLAMLGMFGGFALHAQSPGTTKSNVSTLLSSSPDSSPASSSNRVPARATPSSTNELPPPAPAGEIAPTASGDRLTPFAPVPIPATVAKPSAPPSESQPASDPFAAPHPLPGYFGAITDDRQKIPGVRVIEVLSGGPAELAGLRAGDLLTSIDDQPIREMADLAKIITTSRAGQTLKIVYQRGATLNAPGASAVLQVVLGERPPEHERRYPQFGRIDEDATLQEEAARPSGMLLGVRAALLDTAGQRRLGVPVSAGALVLEVVPGSPAEHNGIPRDAVIVSVNGLLVDSPDALTREILQAGPGAEIEMAYYLGRALLKRRVLLGGQPVALGQNDFTPRPIAEDPHGEASARARIEQLELRIEVLQRRLEQLEQQLRQ